MQDYGQPPPARDRLPTAQEGLEARSRELEAILYAVSHDLRSPLVTIQGFGQELVRSCEQVRAIIDNSTYNGDTAQKIRDLLDTDIAEAVQFIQSGATKMDSLLAGLLKLSRMGRAPLAMTQVDMNELISSVVASLQPQIEDAGANVTVEALPGCQGDENQLQLLFASLIDNSLKFRDPKRPCSVHISGSGDPQQAVYCISDNGLGMATEHLERVFDFGYRLRAQDSSSVGIGLPLARRITLRHGGSIHAKSLIGRGTQLFVTLPG